MILLKLCLCLMLVSGDANTNKITVIGQSKNAKAGAVVISNQDQKTYYLDKISSWDDSVVGKLVRVTGKLIIEDIKPPKPGDPPREQIVGLKLTLTKLKWELVE